jgi:hypothetical protein
MITDIIYKGIHRLPAPSGVDRRGTG